MKKLYLKLKVAVLAAIAAVATFVDRAATNLFTPKPMGLRLKQGGFVSLIRPYAGYPAGQVVEFPGSLEAALIASGGAVTSSGPPTTGNVSTTALSGCVAIAAGASSVVITNPNITVQTIIFAVVAQAAADGTLLRVERVVCAAGSATIYGTANATATTLIDWAIINQTGAPTNPQ